MVSLIITTYNYAHYIERAIRSALDQSLAQSEYEIIVVNDGSTDATSQILDNYSESSSSSSACEMKSRMISIN